MRIYTLALAAFFTLPCSTLADPDSTDKAQFPDNTAKYAKIIKAAKAGDQLSQLRAFALYHFGYDGYPDDWTALRYAEMAAKGRDQYLANIARSVLGEWYAQSDPQLAVRYLERPAAYGDTSAQRILYFIYLPKVNHEFQVVGDPVKAYVMGRLAFRDDHQDGAADTSKDLTSEQVRKGEKALSAYLRAHPHALDAFPTCAQCQPEQADN